MEEVKFVFKCFLISCVVVVFSQTRVSGETLENKAFVFLQHSETAQWLRDAAGGGIKIIRQGSEITKSFISEKVSQINGSKHKTIVIHKAEATDREDSDAGLFRKLDRSQAQLIKMNQQQQRQVTQQRGMTAESEINSEENLDQY